MLLMLGQELKRSEISNNKHIKYIENSQNDLHDKQKN